MYESYLRAPHDPWFPADRVDWHRGTRDDYVVSRMLAAVKAARDGKQAIKAIGPQFIKWVTDARMLRAAWDLLAGKGNTAPGPNGRRYDDLDDHEVWDLLKNIGLAIRDGAYRHGGERQIDIPKDRTDLARGTRPISLINVEDRSVERTVYDVLVRLLDPLFGRNVLGFRPRLGRLHALALAEVRAIDEGCFVLVAEDVKDAFTHVPIKRLLDILAVYVPADELLWLVSALLETGKKHGIRQGGPLSPLLLNLYLRHVLDEPWRKMWPHVPMIRVADDILLLCRTLKQAREARAALDALLRPASMRLKGDPDETIRDLRAGVSATWLGFTIGRGEGLFEVKIADKAWRRLSGYLELAHEKSDSPVRAMETINGWIDQMAPCYPHVRRPRVFDRLEALAVKQGFDEIPSRDALTSRWRRAHGRWCEVRDEVRNRPQVLDGAWGNPAGERQPEPLESHAPSSAPF